MVRDGIYYALAMAGLVGLLAWLAGPAWSLFPLLLGVFFLWFFRDPERPVPGLPGAIVSPADGRVTDIATVLVDGEARTRISIFLSVFDVHVNRSPIGGVVRKVEYRKGQFRNALYPVSAVVNEQNIVTVEGEGQTVVFKQIAGVLARRIVFSKRPGEPVARGERVGMIKFGSRVDILLDPVVSVQVAVGQHVAGGASVLAIAPVTAPRSEAPSAGMVNVTADEAGVRS